MPVCFSCKLIKNVPNKRTIVNTKTCSLLVEKIKEKATNSHFRLKGFSCSPNNGNNAYVIKQTGKKYVMVVVIQPAVYKPNDGTQYAKSIITMSNIFLWSLLMSCDKLCTNNKKQALVRKANTRRLCTIDSIPYTKKFIIARELQVKYSWYTTMKSLKGESNICFRVILETSSPKRGTL